MPLMYVADKPEAVRITGTIHGILFVIYVVTLMQAALVLKQPLSYSVKNLSLPSFQWDPR
jgi:integral membrane protein